MNRPSDIYVFAGMLAATSDWTYRSLAASLHVSHATVQRATERGDETSLYSVGSRGVNRAHFEDFAVHALRFVAPVRLGPIVSGIPAAWAAEPMASLVRSSGNDPIPVWPHAEGRVRGQALTPLHDAAPEAVNSWPALGEWLSVLDCLRAGDVRTRAIAGDLLTSMLRRHGGE